MVGRDPDHTVAQSPGSQIKHELNMLKNAPPPAAGARINPLPPHQGSVLGSSVSMETSKPTSAASCEADSGRSSPAAIGRAGEEGEAAG